MFSGNDIISPGSSCGSGVSDDIASALGVMPGTKVGGGLIDAYAGFLGTSVPCVFVWLILSFENNYFLQKYKVKISICLQVVL